MNEEGEVEVMKEQNLFEYCIERWPDKYKNKDFCRGFMYQKQITDKFKELTIKVDEECEEYDTYVRRPYYRLRGKRITEEQALDIIRRTDDFVYFDTRNRCKKEDMVNLYHFRNFWLTQHHYPPFHGWVQPDGLVGGNGITDKYPTYDEILDDIIDMKLSFPYLEFIVAITCWNEVPDYVWDNDCNSIVDGKLDNFSDFNENIDIVFHVHDDLIEILSGEEGAKRYDEMLPKYEEGVKNDEIYSSDYYYDRKINPVSKEFIKKCMEIYGVSVEEYENEPHMK